MGRTPGNDSKQGRRRGAADPPAIPGTGALLALLTHANTTGNPMAALVSSMLGSYYNQTGPTPAELCDAFLGQTRLCC